MGWSQYHTWGGVDFTITTLKRYEHGEVFEGIGSCYSCLWKGKIQLKSGAKKVRSNLVKQLHKGKHIFSNMLTCGA